MSPPPPVGFTFYAKSTDGRILGPSSTPEGAGAAARAYLDRRQDADPEGASWPRWSETEAREIDAAPLIQVAAADEAAAFELYRLVSGDVDALDHWRAAFPLPPGEPEPFARPEPKRPPAVPVVREARLDPPALPPVGLEAVTRITVALGVLVLAADGPGLAALAELADKLTGGAR